MAGLRSFSRKLRPSSMYSAGCQLLTAGTLSETYDLMAPTLQLRGQTSLPGAGTHTTEACMATLLTALVGLAEQCAGELQHLPRLHGLCADDSGPPSAVVCQRSHFNSAQQADAARLCEVCPCLQAQVSTRAVLQAEAPVQSTDAPRR